MIEQEVLIPENIVSQIVDIIVVKEKIIKIWNSIHPKDAANVSVIVKNL